MSLDLAAAARQGIDFKRLAEDFKGLDSNDPGLWPTAPRVARRTVARRRVGG